MSKKRALITGITGQDGSYLTEFLLLKGYEVHGVVRRVAIEDPEHRMPRLSRIRGQVQFHAASVESYASVYQVVQDVQPDECYHLAAQSFVSYSFDDEFSTLNTNVNGTHFVLSALRHAAPKCRFYFAGSSEMFGKAEEVPQTETTRFHPRSSYGISKVAGFDLTRNYREAYGMHASNGILFNHESPRRGYEFVTRKITTGVAQIWAGKTDELRLGNLDAKRDWGHARDYVMAMWMMLQQPEPDDYVIAMPASILSRTLSSTGQPKSTRCSETRPRHGRNWAGNPRSGSRNWSKRWSKPIAGTWGYLRRRRKQQTSPCIWQGAK
jgi:GDPmannose 4,6-dehydratase